MMRVLLGIYAALGTALATVGGYLIILDSTSAPAWLMVVLAAAAVAAALGSAKFFAWNDPRTASRRLTRPPWWWIPLLAVVIGSGPFLGRLAADTPLLMVLFMLVTAAAFGLAVYSIRRDWPRKRGKTPVAGQPEGDRAHHTG